jgi:glyoxylase-like metal-dependent hydrolase (beta-lactamase superfamily II)
MMPRVEFIYGDSSRPEFGDMFGGWLTEHDGRVFMVDCGVGTGAATLVERLKKRVERLDYLLLTHIHMDHAGGAAEILKAFPKAKAVVHAKGLRHLVDPARLWAGTREVMGELAEMYGRPEPIDAARLTAHTDSEIAGLKIIETPGHAQHHLSYRLGGTMFVGEAGGCPSLIGGRLHARPATAPRYLPQVTLASIDRLLEEPDGPAYFGHTHEMMPLRPALEL